MSYLGIYFGAKAVDISEIEGKKLINSLQIPLTGITDNELDEKVPADIKLVASFNDAFRRNKIKAKEATICFSGEDLIIRAFEIPVLPKEEMHEAISFEAKKYMPFKTEELISDYQVELDNLNRTNVVLFMGIKKETFIRYFSIVNQLNLKIISIEYSGFSVLRFLKLSGVNQNGIIGVLCLDSQGQDEINFTVLENGFPLFSRNMNLSIDMEAADLEGGLATSLFLDKLKSEIHVSLDYYQRKFSFKPMKNIFVISNPDLRQDIEAFMVELGLSSKFVDIAKIIGKPMAYSSSFVKSYSSALAKKVATKVRINLIESKLRVDKAEVGGGQVDVVALLKKIKVDLRFVVVGALVCIASFAYGLYQEIPLKQKLADITSKWDKISKANQGASYETLNANYLKYGKTLENLNKLIKNQLFITETMDIMPRSLPEGVWLNRFTFSNKDADKAELILEGMCYLGDSSEEFLAVNTFFNNLNMNTVFTKYFSDISIVSIDRGQFNNTALTTFFISCKAFKERK